VRTATAQRHASLWRIYKVLAGAVVSAILGATEPAVLLARASLIVRHICDPPRKRQPQMRALASTLGPEVSANGGQPHPSGKVPPAPEGLRRGCQGRQGDRGHRADPGDGHKPMRRFVRPGPLDDLTIQKRNLLVQPMKRVDQDLEDRSGDLRERLIRVHNSLTSWET
jgi:hypothetical protein